jgi:peptidoglycan/xylan/chitin deacetylase (PgdA/CDA1 family)
VPTLLRRVLLTALGLGLLTSGAGFAPVAEAARGCPPPAPSVVRTAPGSGKTVALTFDDGPASATPPILAVLRRYDVRATFFDTGLHDAQHPGTTRLIAAEGHLVGDHTWEHRYPADANGHWSRRYLGDQLSRTNAQQQELTGRPTCYFRPPGGFETPGMVDVARAHGMSTVLWSIDTLDWQQAAHTTRASTRMIEQNAAAGYGQQHPIVLMHTGKASHEPESQVSSNRSNDVAALASVIRGYRDHGYRFVDLAGRSGLPAATTTLSVAGGTVSAPAGRPVPAVTGTLRSLDGPAAKQPLHWYSRPHGHGPWTERGSVPTDRSGTVRVSDRPAGPTDYTLRFLGTSRYQPASSTRTHTVLTLSNPTTPSPTPSASPSASSSALPTPSSPAAVTPPPTPPPPFWRRLLHHLTHPSWLWNR